MFGTRLDSIISPISPYGLSTKTVGQSKKDDEHSIRLFSSKGISYINKNTIHKSEETILTYRTMVSQTSAEHAGEPSKDGKFKVITNSLRVLKPGDVCTHSYIFVGPLNSAEEAKNIENYLKTKFARFLILQALTSIHLSKSTFCFVPIQDFSKCVTDRSLYIKYKLAPEEIATIENLIKEMN